MAKGTLNKVIIIGRLGKDPDIRYTASGTAMANLNVATDERAPAGDGNWEDRTEWHRIVAFGKTAEFCGNYLSKGRMILVEGSIRTRQWEDQQGGKRYTTEIVAREIQFMGGAADQSAAPQRGASGNHMTNPGYDSRSYVEELPPQAPGGDEEIPF